MYDERRDEFSLSSFFNKVRVGESICSSFSSLFVCLEAVDTLRCGKIFDVDVDEDFILSVGDI